MRFLIFGILAMGIAFGATAAQGEIYVWTDDQGVKHFSNSPPPVGAEGLEHREEQPHDAETHQRRLAEEEESYRLFQEAEAQRTRQAREQELIRLQQAAQRETTEAARRAEAAALKAAEAAEKAKNRSTGYIVLPARHRFQRPLPYDHQYHDSSSNSRSRRYPRHGGNSGSSNKPRRYYP